MRKNLLADSLGRPGSRLPLLHHGEAVSDQGRNADEKTAVVRLDRKLIQRIAVWYQTVILEKLLRQHALPASIFGRQIPLSPYARKEVHDDRRGNHASFISNSIRSARYTVWDFLPRQVWFQATRLNNVYFICIGVPQTIPGLSTTGSYTTILPLLFFVLLTVVKEGIDDWRRHRMDRVENARKATVIRLTESQGTELGNLLSWCKGIVSRLGKKPVQIDTKEELDLDDEFAWTDVKWRDIKVGDVIRLQRDDAVPADIVLLSTTGEDGVAYVETMALDGETNLKTKQAPSTLQACSTIANIKACDANFTLEDPNRDLYDFNGRVTKDGKAVPLTLNEILLRGSVLRNVGSAIGVVVNTGEECKIRMNANHHPKAKKPRLERYSNQVVLTLVAYVVILSVGLSGGYLMWHRSTERHSWYLNNAYVPFKEILVGFLIMFNNVIPLAMYVSLEIVKVGQMIMVHSDVEMFDQVSNTPMTCNTNTILENLGQVSYVLSDKTGTLTENVMKLRKMSVAGIAWQHRSENEVESRGERTSQGDHGVVEFDGKAASLGADAYELKALSEIHGATLRTSQRLSSDRMHSGDHEDSDMTHDTRDLLQYIRQHPSSTFARKARKFILAVALCHTALPDTHEDGSVDFQASSPDEIALVRAARDMGLLLIQRSTQSITLEEQEEDGELVQSTYEVLNVIEFSSKRKRMSIIVRCPDGRLWLLCKGADNVITPRLQQAALATRKSQEVRRSIQLDREAYRRSEQLVIRRSLGARPSLTMRRASSMECISTPSMDQAKKQSDGIRIQTKSLDVPRRNFDFLEGSSVVNDAAVFTRCFRQLDDFANEGLRTLVYAGKYIVPDGYQQWQKEFTDATTSLENRQQRIEDAAEIVEQGLDLLGVSAIEDKLQEGVPETIEKLWRANIKIWMLTGDKRETAINIAHSARICKPESEIFILDASKGEIDSQLRTLSLDLHTGCLHSVVVIDGHTLGVIDASPDLTGVFYNLIPSIDSVICCRASPAQKASLVESIRRRIPKALTLAIGDGANDIAMIQASHVGVGISGKEGLQAARVADYSFAQFCFLQRLLFVHGRWNYIRTAKFILWTFWKEMFFYMMQALYLRYNGYTGTSLYENWSLTVLNTLFTSLCVIIPGIFEQDLSAATLLAVPELYIHGQQNMSLHMTKYLRWTLRATYEGIVVWWLSYAAFSIMNPTVRDNGLFALGDLCFSTAIVYTNTKLLILETHTKTIIVWISFFITVGGWWVWNIFMSAVYSDNLSPYDVRSGFTNGFGKDPVWWLTLLLALVLLLLVEILIKLGRREFMLLWQGRGKGISEAGKVDADVELWQGLERAKVVLDRLQSKA